VHEYHGVDLKIDDDGVHENVRDKQKNKRLKNHQTKMKYFRLLLLFLALEACQNQKETSQVFFPKPPEAKLDSVGTWLLQRDHYLTEDKYTAFLYKHVNQQIASNNLDSAARLLAIGGAMYFNNDTFDSLIVKKHLDFLSKYENQIKPHFRARLYLNLGELFIADNEIEKSMACFRKNNFKPTDYYSAYYIAKSQNSLVYDFITIGQIDSAIVYAQKALPFFEKYDDKYAQATVYGDLQAAHRSMGNFQEAEKYALQAIKLHTALQNSADIFDALYNLYILREEKKQKTSQSDSLSASEDAVINFENQWKSSKPKHKLAAQTILAARYFRDSNYVETGRILDRITPLFALVDSRYHSESFVTLLGQYESALHKPLSLRKYYVERLQEAENDHEFNLVQTYNWLLSQEAKGLNDYKKAYEYSLASNEAANKRNIEKIRDDASELDKKYQTEKKEVQIKQQADDAAKKNIFIAFLGLGLAVLLYFYNTLKKKAL
jgi:hypothetical protein